jgi:pimeloyl-ACP methyl ester carboxylesterase
LIDPEPFPNQELKGFQVPVLIIMEDHEPDYNCEKRLKRALTFIQQVRTFKVPNAKHFVNVVQAEIVNKHIVEFLEN